MMKFKTFFAAALMMLGVCATASAQDANDEFDPVYKPYPHMFVSAQGGIQVTPTSGIGLGDLITPTASVGFGAFFTPVVGARLHVNGMWNKGGVEWVDPNPSYKWKYVTTDLDLMVNLVTLFGKKNYYPMNLYLIGGVGLNYAWDNKNAQAMPQLLPMAYKDRFSHNARVGLQADYNINKHFSVNAEIDCNFLSDRYNSKINNKDDIQLTAQVGIAYKFGYKKKPVAEKKYITKLDTIPYDDTDFVTRIEDGRATWNVFYLIRESNFEEAEGATEQLAAIGAFLADHRECKIDVKSYADVQTGNPKINMMYSQQRNEKAVKALVEAGVNPDQITASYYGDTVQPFEENDKNRVTIITATGLKEVKDAKPVRRFRTREVRVIEE